MLGADDVRLSVAVMAHPSRAHFVEGLVPLLGYPPVVWDERNDRWDTGRRSMLAFDPKADWHLVVQDDAVLCRDFLRGVRRALEVVGDHPVALYTGRVQPYYAFVSRAVDRAAAEGKTWIEMQGPWWGVAVAVPTHHIEAMIEWCDQRPDVPNYDRRMAIYFDSIGVRCWYSVPSLVDHRVGAENPSLVAGRTAGKGRVAFRFIGAQSPLEIEWTDTAVDAGRPGSAGMGQQHVRRPRRPGVASPPPPDVDRPDRARRPRAPQPLPNTPRTEA